MVHGLPELSDCRFEANGAGWGGGLYAHDVTVERCWFLHNTAAYVGAGVALSGAIDALVADCIMTGNEALCGGAGMVYNGAGTFANCTMVFNTASEEGCCGKGLKPTTRRE